MSVADLHDLELIWPSAAPRDVIVTGTFDQWSASIRLAKGDSGFSGTVKAPWGQKIVYKYIIDGLWRCREDQPQEDDGHGNINNVLQTPKKPAAPSVPSLSIPADCGEVEAMMVTAVEFLPSADLTSIRGPFPIPQLTVQGLDQAPSAVTPVSEAKLDTAAATEGAVSLASEPPEEFVPMKQASPSCDASIPPVDDTYVSPTNQNGEALDVHSLATSAPIQFTKEEPLAPPVPNTAERTVSEPVESEAPEPSPLPQVAQDVSAPDRVEVSSASAPAVPEPAEKQPEAEPPGTVEQGHTQEVMMPASTSQAATSSAPTSIVATHKKRWSLFARIKHVFDKNTDRKGRKEKHKH